MPKRAEIIESTILTLELLRRIPRTRKVTAAELRDQLEAIGLVRDLRTIQRQLEALSGHFNIERDTRSKPFGYRWPENSRGMSLPALSEHESLLLALAEHHLRALLPPVLMRSLQGHFDQARTNLLPRAGSRIAGDWRDKVRVVSETQPLLPPAIDPAVFEVVSGALYANHWLDVNYTDVEGCSTQKKVMPLGLAQQGNRLYLVCRYADKTGERMLAVNRINRAVQLTLRFDRPADFNLAGYDQAGNFGFPTGRRVRLSFEIKRHAGQHLLESRLSHDQSVTTVGNYYRINATVQESAQLHWWLKGFGREIRKISINPARKRRDVSRL